MSDDSIETPCIDGGKHGLYAVYVSVKHDSDRHVFGNSFKRRCDSFGISMTCMKVASRSASVKPVLSGKLSAPFPENQVRFSYVDTPFISFVFTIMNENILIIKMVKH